ncbi:MerR family transcriptional regulator [Novosphingobium terrae]|uniref:MerR family transcriptional regulator n=1 Tax=Novosphingobium terrae TaxID=2726189 RepID=UPI001F12FE79|nr:MerR family transcriptional regulator [Novosphingobium terrae]
MAPSGDIQALLNDGKAPDALRTIGEVTRALSIAPHVLRYWEEQFPMLRPVKRSGGRRYYRPEDVVLLVEIHRLVHAQGYTLRGARQYLEERARAPKAAAQPVIAIPEPAKPQPLLPLLMDAPPLAPVLGLPQDDLLDALIGLRGDLARLLGEE